jgi:hypothetical protein
VLGLTAGDYLLWNWSLSGSHDVPALVSGLTLPPLAAASMLLIATTVLRLVTRSTRRLGAAQTSRHAEPEITVQRVSEPRGSRDATAPVPNDREWAAPGASEDEAQPVAAGGDQRGSSRKLAA